MDRVARHYEELLAEHYTWMSGMSLEAKAAEQRVLLEGFEVARGDMRLAVDLGSGPGYQSLALADMGFKRVLALDTSQALLDELMAARGDLPIAAIRADLRELPALVQPGAADVIVCMGDTLTHLDSREDVSRLFADAYTALAPDGLLVLTFRDLSTELIGVDRFIPVRADADRIMLCVLDYEPETVTVSDLVHIREGEDWSLHKSSYRKLRLAPSTVGEELERLGFAIERSAVSTGRMHAIVVRKSVS